MPMGAGNKNYKKKKPSPKPSMEGKEDKSKDDKGILSNKLSATNLLSPLRRDLKRRGSNTLGRLEREKEACDQLKKKKEACKLLKKKKEPCKPLKKKKEPYKPLKKKQSPRILRKQSKEHSPKHARQKRSIYLVRHGESRAEALRKSKTGNSQNIPSMIDAGLSEDGLKKAQEFKVWLQSIKPDLVVSSPLERAIKTAEFACGGIALRTVLNITCASQLVYACDIGTSLTSLAQKHKKFLLPSTKITKDRWWYGSNRKREDHATSLGKSPPVGLEPHHTFKKRVEEFRSWLDKQKEQTIVVFTHPAVIAVLLYGKGESKDGYIYRYNA